MDVPSTFSTLQLARCRHRICIADIFYCKHLVSIVLPEELAHGGAAPCSKSLSGIIYS